MSVRILQGDSREVMRTLGDSSVDAIVTDPPYGLEFMGKGWDAPWKQTSGGFTSPGIGERERAWPSYQGSNRNRCETCGLLIGQGGSPCRCDSPKPKLQDAQRMRLFQAWCEEWAVETLRVLKPGGYLLAFSGTRTYHRMACAIEDVGFEIRDQIGWAYGSGFPKSHNGEWGGTALKPAWEPICIARKPLIGTVEANWREHGTGALNIDGCRVAPTGEGHARDGESSQDRRYTEVGSTSFSATPGPRGGDPLGRWPANLIHDGSDEVLACFPDAPGQQGDLHETGRSRPSSGRFGDMAPPLAHAARKDAGSAARFFYCAKASKADRNEGLEGLEGRETTDGRQVPAGSAYQRGKTKRQNHHPTVKPTDLMRYLCRLVTPAGGLVLDPFMGSGSTLKAAELEGFSAIGIELDPAYIKIARRRIAADMPLFVEVT